MVRASITLTIPDRIWIGQISREFPNARFQIRSAQYTNGIGVAFVEILATDLPTVLQQINDADAVRTLEIFQHTEDRALVQIEADNPVPLDLLSTAGVPVETPFEICDGKVYWKLTTTRDRLSSLAQELERSDIGYMVEHVWNSVQFDRILTKKQQEVLETALEAGYYDSPRESTQEDIAAELDMAKSTCSETLHRAEERIIKQFEEGKQPLITQPAQPA